MAAANPKLNQIVAVVAGKKTRSEKDFGELNKILQKSDLFAGITKQYQPLNEEGEQLPPEHKNPQKNIKDIIKNTRELLTDIIDAVATQEYGNTVAKGNIIVDGETIIKDVPVTVLLYLEKQLNDLNTFVGNIPTLDPAEQWKVNPQSGQYETDSVKTVRTKKVQKPLILHPATEQHPAQTQLITEDVTAGHWTTRKFATCLSSSEKQTFITKIHKLQDAIKIAREEANGIEVKQVKIAESFLNYIFGGN